MISEHEIKEDVEAAQEEFFSHLYIMASYNEVAGTNLSYVDFVNTEDKSQYIAAFEMANQRWSL